LNKVLPLLIIDYYGILSQIKLIPDLLIFVIIHQIQA